VVRVVAIEDVSGRGRCEGSYAPSRALAQDRSRELVQCSTRVATSSSNLIRSANENAARVPTNRADSFRTKESISFYDVRAGSLNSPRFLGSPLHSLVRRECPPLPQVESGCPETAGQRRGIEIISSCRLPRDQASGSLSRQQPRKMGDLLHGLGASCQRGMCGWPAWFVADIGLSGLGALYRLSKRNETNEMKRRGSISRLDRAFWGNMGAVWGVIHEYRHKYWQLGDSSDFQPPGPKTGRSSMPPEGHDGG